jgi:tRNA(adenine34) deaminase
MRLPPWIIDCIIIYNWHIKKRFSGVLLQSDEKWMRAALSEAGKACRKMEVPVGAVLIREGRIMARGYNQTESLNDPTAHAEMMALRAAAGVLGSWRLNGCSLYVTLEPCAMCAGALVLARIDRLVFGASDPKAGACGTLYNIVRDKRLNHEMEVTGGILADDAIRMMQAFFRDLRNGKEKV